MFREEDAVAFDNKDTYEMDIRDFYMALLRSIGAEKRIIKRDNKTILKKI